MKKLSKQIIVLTCIFSMLLSVEVFAASAKIKLNASSVTITVGSSKTIKATVTGKSKKVTWKSSNTSVATVNSGGKITGKKAGTATITAKANGTTAKCKVTVKKAKAVDVSKYFNKKLSDTVKVLGFKHIKSKDQKNRVNVDFGKSVSNVSQFYSKNGSFSKSKTYLYGDTAFKNKKGAWNIYINDKNYSIYGITIGTSASDASAKMKKNGWIEWYKGFYIRKASLVRMEYKNNKVSQISYYWQMESEY